MADTSGANASPWRALFETVRNAIGTRRDEHGTLGSINWLRKQMETRGANPNVVRNIIYRNKGKLADKRILFAILRELWATVRDEPLHAPDIELLLTPSADAEQEILQALGREKRRAYRSFVQAVRDEHHPKLLLIGRPGSGKTLLTDYIQQALQVSLPDPARTIRIEFGSSDLATTLLQLGERLGIERDELDARLAKIAAASAFAVQADAQAELARSLVEQVRRADSAYVLLVHVSQTLARQQTLADAPLRRNTPDVPRLTAPDWLWTMLLEPLSLLPNASVLLSLTDLPARALETTAGFGPPVKLAPPNAAESRRFVKARLPHLSPGDHEAIVQRAGRSFEELRTMTLLAEIRAPLPDADSDDPSIARLSALVTASVDSRLRDFLGALATVSLPAFPTFSVSDLTALRPSDQGPPNDLESAFLDAVPAGGADEARCFSRRLVRALRERLASEDPARGRRLHAHAAARLAPEASDDPTGSRAARYVHHLFEARQWEALVDWIRRHGAPPSLVRQVWEAAENELGPADDDTFERIAEQVAAYYVNLGTFLHPDARSAFVAMTGSQDPRRRAWSAVKQAEGAVLRGDHGEADRLLGDWVENCNAERGESETEDGLISAEAELVRASIARWRGELETAAGIVEHEVRPRLARLDGSNAAVRLAHAKAAVWAGLIHKDRGDLEAAANEFDGVEVHDDLLQARLAFQSGEVALALGRAGAARAAFDDAVERAERSGALASERARYLARRGTLHLRADDVAAAEADHEAAIAVLEDEPWDEVERAFYTARVDVERSEAHLAYGRHDRAIELLDRAVARFRSYGEARGVDAEYRIDRATLRLATAYLARATGVAWRPPYPILTSGPAHRDDADHALHLLRRVAERVPAGTEEAQVPDALARRALLLTSLFTDENTAQSSLVRARRLKRCRHDETETEAFVAAFALRSDDAIAATTAVERAWTVLDGIDDPVGDPGLTGWLVALDAHAAIALGDVASFDAAVERLVHASAAACVQRRMREPMQERVLRAIGGAIEHHGRRSWLERSSVPRFLRVVEEDDRLRLGDRLASQRGAGYDTNSITAQTSR